MSTQSQNHLSCSDKILKLCNETSNVSTCPRTLLPDILLHIYEHLKLLTDIFGLGRDVDRESLHSEILNF